MYTRHIQPVCLPSNAHEDLTNQGVSLTGWGATKLVKRKDDYKEEMQSKVPKRVSFQIASEQFCLSKVYDTLKAMNKTVPVIDAANETLICGFNFKDFNSTYSEATCSGDSGGNII